MNYQFNLEITINTDNLNLLTGKSIEENTLKQKLNNINLSNFFIGYSYKKLIYTPDYFTSRENLEILNHINSNSKKQIILNVSFYSDTINNCATDIEYLNLFCYNSSFNIKTQGTSSLKNIVDIELNNFQKINSEDDLFLFLNNLISFLTINNLTSVRDKDGNILWNINNNMEKYAINFVLNILKTNTSINNISLIDLSETSDKNLIKFKNNSLFILENINMYLDENDTINANNLLEFTLKFASKYLSSEFLYNTLANEIFFFRKKEYFSSFYKSTKLIYGSDSLILSSDLDNKEGLVVNRDLTVKFCNEYSPFLKDMSKYFFSQQKNDIINVGLLLNEYKDKYKLSIAKFFLEYDKVFVDNLDNKNKYSYNLILSQNNKDYIILTYRGSSNSYDDILNEVVEDFYNAVLKTLNAPKEDKLLIINDEKDFLSILKNKFNDIVFYTNCEFNKYKFVKINNDIDYGNLSLIKSQHDYYYFIDNTNNKPIEFKNYFDVVSSISKQFSNLNISKQNKLLRKILNYENVVYIDNSIYDVLCRVSKKFNLKINNSFKTVGKLHSLNVEGKYIHVDGENFTYYSAILSEDDFSKSYIKVFDNPNNSVGKINKKEDVKLGKFLEMFFTFENNKQLDDVIQFITKPSSSITLFQSDKIHKIYKDTTQSFTSCMRNKSTMTFLKDEKRVKVIVIHNSLFDENNISGEIFGRALLWEEKEWLLLDTLYCRDSHKNEYTKMLQNYVFNLSKKLNKKFLYIRTNRDTLYKVNINENNIKQKIDNSSDKLVIKDVNFDYNAYKKSGDTFYLDTFYFYDVENKILSNCEIHNSDSIVKIRRT